MASIWHCVLVSTHTKETVDEHQTHVNKPIDRRNSEHRDVWLRRRDGYRRFGRRERDRRKCLGWDQLHRRSHGPRWDNWLRRAGQYRGPQRVRGKCRDRRHHRVGRTAWNGWRNGYRRSHGSGWRNCFRRDDRNGWPVWDGWPWCSPGRWTTRRLGWDGRSRPRRRRKRWQNRGWRSRDRRHDIDWHQHIGCRLHRRHADRRHGTLRTEYARQCGRRGLVTVVQQLE